ncbi:glycosyltransferase family 39 protein [Halobacillus halophilus]|uniref:glycosyltransferase family 39 protein n=1 Tax=Halobacillus halophilus TaxID=1570 RepID=UPI0019293F57|nr:glycosyltransferase family 39 protein [Halobacillus halophilus]
MLKRWKGKKLDPWLLGSVILVSFLNFFLIWEDEYANNYYTTAVGSMMESFHNFFYASLDSAGSVTVDKPPVTFWIQTISAEIFGLSGWSVILPQALAGVGSVLLVYFLVKPNFGALAARIASLAMAVTPIAVAVSRTNNIDSMLVFTLLAGTWFLFKGVREQKLWSIVAAFALIGIGFNMKMLQAYMVVPAFVLFVWVAMKAGWKKKLTTLAASLFVLLSISLSWALVVDLTPADERPYIGSSSTNSVLELAFGYNGMSRLLGQDTGGDGSGTDQGALPAQDASDAQPSGLTDAAPGSQDTPSSGTQEPPQVGTSGQPAGAAQGGGGGGMFDLGDPGVLRLLQDSLADQASWLLPFALFAAAGLLAGARWKSRTEKHNETIFWLAWLLPVAGFFSVAGFFHHYYLIMLAPPLAALFGAGSVELLTLYKGEGWKSWLLPAAVFTTAATQWWILQPYEEEIGSFWSILILGLGIVVTAGLVLMKQNSQPIKQTVAVAGTLILLIVPTFWSLTPIVYGGNSALPEAGPSTEMSMPQGNAPQGQGDDDRRVSAKGLPDDMPLEDGPGSGTAAEGGDGQGGGAGPVTQDLDEKTLEYLRENNTGETYLFGTVQYSTATPYIVDEKESVMIMGGFSGSDPVYSVEELEAAVAEGDVSYFLLSESQRGGSNEEVTTWIQENGTAVPEEEWQSTSTDGFTQLYKVTLENGGE